MLSLITNKIKFKFYKLSFILRCESSNVVQCFFFFKFQTRIRRRKRPVDSHIGRASPEGGGLCLVIPHTSIDTKKLCGILYIILVH